MRNVMMGVYYLAQVFGEAIYERRNQNSDKASEQSFTES
jgi:hypothetical protein